jgi:two-component system response regulator WspF
MRIAIVNDMALAREALRRVVQSVPGQRVAWLAADGDEAIEQSRRDRPDLILMDLIMPRTDGVEATRRIMAESPCPIVVVTSSVSGNLHKVYEAMGHGALDAIDTPTLGPNGELRGGQPLLDKVATVGKLIGKPYGRGTPSSAPPTSPTYGLTQEGEALVAIGASTGGPNALVEVLATFPANLGAATVIIQHVDLAFAPGLAHWLAERTGRPVEVVEDGARPREGSIYLAATNDHLVIDDAGAFRYVGEPLKLSYRPSADVFFASAARHWRGGGVAVLLTGMGRDGAAGMLALRSAGWYTIAQDQATSVVWGMPRAAVELNAAVDVLPVSDIGRAVVRHVTNTKCTSGGGR